MEGSQSLALSLGLGAGLLVLGYLIGSKQRASRGLRHIVCFKLKEGTSDSAKQQIVQAFSELARSLPDIVSDYECGVNNSPEEFSDGFTYIFLLTFPSEEARAKYLPHPVLFSPSSHKKHI